MVPYINYNELDEFYTLKGVGNLLKMGKETLKQSCKRYDINPQRNEIGDWGLSRYDLRRLHNFKEDDFPAIDSGDEDRA